MDFSSHFKNKKITVMGLGLLGRGVGDARFLAECGADVTVTDLKSEEELEPSVAQLRSFPNVRFVLGRHEFADFENVDMVLVAAGVPKDSPFLLHAQKNEVTCVMSAALFLELSGIPMIGITGTRGKSTVTAMIHHVLTAVTGEEVILGGNIRGISNFELLKKVTEDSLAVFELDSWQLQGFGWASVSPHVAVFTNFMEDHQNYYRGDMDAYFMDKAHIFLHQEENGTLVTTPEVFERAARLPKATLGQEVVFADASVLPEDFVLRVPGEHNRQNAALALYALRALSLTDEEILDGLSTFAGVPGRLEYVGEVEGIKVYNDNNATTPQATIAGIKALAETEKKNIVLIAGGAYKDVDPSPLVEAIELHCKAVILIPGTGTKKLRNLLQVRDGIPYFEVGSLEEAVEKGWAVGVLGDVLLFSPAFASFGMFKNEYERNDEFMTLVRKCMDASESFYAGGFLYNTKTNSILLQKRDEFAPSNPNKWSFFGGSSETGESPLETFVREFEEETRFVLDTTRILPLVSYQNEREHKMRHIFFVKTEKNIDVELQEGADYGWFTCTDALELDLSDVARRDLEFFEQQYGNKS
jgi:UDP-N-acetylmuramoylalanine--D-glutamate ligase